MGFAQLLTAVPLRVARARFAARFLGMTVPDTLSPPPPNAMRSLDPRVVALWRLGAVINTVLLSLVAFAASLLFDDGAVWLAGAFILLFLGSLIAVVMPARRYLHWTFQVGEDAVVLRHGVWWRTESIVPHVRIQHVDTRHGPLQRARGLASVVLYTAGSVGAMLVIPGLALADANELRDQLIALSGKEDAV